jgi:hypothetical protein
VRRVIGALLLLLVTAGCSAGSPPTPVPTPAPSTVAAPEGVASATVPGEQGVTISVTDATVTGELLRLTYAVTPTTPPARSYSVADLAGRNPAPYLVDVQNLQRYDVVQANARSVTSDPSTSASGGAPVVMTAYFAAPPTNTDHLELAWGSAPWPTLDVPVAR